MDARIAGLLPLPVAPDLIPPKDEKDVVRALKELTERYNKTYSLLRQDINTLMIPPKPKEESAPLEETRAKAEEGTGELEVTAGSTTKVNVRFERLQVGPIKLFKDPDARDPDITYTTGEGARKILQGTITTSGTTVTGSGTQFLTDFSLGDTIHAVASQTQATLGTNSAVVTAIASDTEMTVAAAFPTTVATASYYRRKGHRTNPPFNLSATYTNDTTLGLGALDKTFALNSGYAYVITGALTTVKGEITNMIVQSADFGTTWTPSATTITVNQTTAPDGTSTADKMAETTATAAHYVVQATSGYGVSGATHVCSCYFKMGATRRYVYMSLTDGSDYARQIFDLNGAGAVGSAGVLGGWTITAGSAAITAVGDGWFRCSYKVVTDNATSPSLWVAVSNADGFGGYAGNAGEFVYIWGAQVQQGSAGIALGAYTATTTAPSISTKFTYEYKVGDHIYLNSATTEMRRITAITNDYTMTVHANFTAVVAATGTVAVSAGSATVTGTSTLFLTQFKVGESIYITDTAETRVISAIASDTSLTVSSNFITADASSTASKTSLTHEKRSWLAVHVICSHDGQKIGCILSESHDNPELPNGFSHSRRVHWVRFADTATNGEVFYKWIHYPGTHSIHWNEDTSLVPFLVGPGVNASGNYTEDAWTVINCSAVAPPTASYIEITAYSKATGATTTNLEFRSANARNPVFANSGNVNTSWLCNTANQTGIATKTDVPCDCQQRIEYYSDNATAGSVFVVGYEENSAE